MTEQVAPPISLEDAKQLVSYLESGDNEAACALVEAVSLKDSMELFAEVGKLTRQLHDSLKNFQLESRIKDLAMSDMPDAQSRLSYVMEMTEQAANKTMDAVERSMPIAENFQEEITALMPSWKQLMARELELGQFKQLCHELDTFLEKAAENSSTLNGNLTEVLMAQDFQDLTGQVIRRVIQLVQEVEGSLVHLLTVFSEEENIQAKPEKSVNDQNDATDKVKAEGPIIDKEERDDVVQNQDDVDDLLSSLGF